MRYIANIKYKNDVDFFDKLVTVYSVLFLNRKHWLTDKEREFFVHLVLLYRKGIDLASKEAVKELEHHLGFSSRNKGVYIYRGFLKTKLWLEQTKTGLEIPDFFKKDFKSENLEFLTKLENANIK